MGSLEPPDDRTEWTLVEEYEMAGSTIELRTGGYLHLAGFVDGELIVQDHDVPHHIRQAAETHAKYKGDD